MQVFSLIIIIGLFLFLLRRKGHTQASEQVAKQVMKEKAWKFPRWLLIINVISLFILLLNGFMVGQVINEYGNNQTVLYAGDWFIIPFLLLIPTVAVAVLNCVIILRHLSNRYLMGANLFGCIFLLI